ncbi:adenylate isopentenyltransferase-like [Curcuma longa]|uniref:adenylate isopentenyltransferase-like n=1 Tax=Curcuma longa TaxID=136217 RepID=UPI003D9E3F32
MPLFFSSIVVVFASQLLVVWAGFMRILINRGGSEALLVFRHRATPSGRAFFVDAAQSLPQQSCWRRRRLDVRRSSWRPGGCCVQGNGDAGKESVVVIVGATGTGKSKLAVELAAKFAGEVVNSDKIQVYRGLDVATNKMPMEERRGVAHHLLGELDPAAGELPPAAFREMAARAIAGIVGRGRLAVMAGGSNSFIHAAVAGSFDPRWSPFEDGKGRRMAAAVLRYRCCFLWVDVDAAALEEQLDRRVEEMVAAGMVEELRRYFEEEAASKAGNRRHPGLGKAIGVAEFREYFQGEVRGTPAAYEAAMVAIKTNTRRLAEEQVKKIRRLGEMGWPLRRLDATAAVVGSATEAWERDVAVPAAAAVEQFLKEAAEVHSHRRTVPPPLLFI